MDAVLDTEETTAESGQPVLTRTEYLKFLAVCKRRNNRQLYLIVKLFGGAGFRSQEVLDLTVESVRRGVIDAACGPEQTVSLPKIIQEELLDYAASNRIESGLIFTTRKGKPLNYGWVRHSITALGLEVGADPSAATPRGLRKMYLATQERVYDCLRKLAAQNYDWMLEQEQSAAGWDL